MSANSFGERFRITTFGESHGAALGVVIDGCPAGIPWDEKLLRRQMARRRPGSGKLVSARRETDAVEVLSGVFKGKTLGTPIAMLVRNQDARSKDYKEIREKARPGHADDTWIGKFAHVDHRGGGRASGRETVARVMAGAVAQMLLQELLPSLKVAGYAAQIGPLKLSAVDRRQLTREKAADFADRFAARFPSPSQRKKVEFLLLDAKTRGFSHGGVAEIVVQGVPAGLGQPVFRKLKADLASAIMSVGATTALSFGEGFAAADAEGSVFHSQGEDVYGGIRGGISTGEPIRLQVAFKPTASVLHVAKKGRHDPCIVPRAIPVLQAMTYLVMADHCLWRATDRIGALDLGR